MARRCLSRIFPLALLAVLLSSAAPAGSQDEGLREVQRLTDEAVRLRKAGKLGEAIEVWKRRLALVRKIVGSEYAESVAGSLALLAEMQESNGDLSGAAQSLQGVVDIRARLLGRTHWRVTDARLAVSRVKRLAEMTAEERRRLGEIDRLRVHAFRAFKAKDYAAAGKWQQQAVDLQREVLGKDAPEVAVGLGNGAFFAQMRRDLATARRLHEQALALRRKVLGDHPDTARNLRDLATVLFGEGDRAGAVRHNEEALKLFARTLGEEHAEHVQVLEGLAAARMMLGDYGAAVDDCERLLRIARKVHGKESRPAAAALVRLAQARGATGNLDAGRKGLEEALAIYRRRPMENDLERAECLALLGGFCFALGSDARARECHEEAYRIRKAALGENDLRTLDSLAALAGALEKEGEVAVARRHLETVANAYRRARGRDPLVAHRLLALARLLVVDEPKTARALLNEALEMWQGPGSEGFAYERAGALGVLALVAGAQGRWDEAGERMDEARRLRRPFLTRALGGLAEADRLAYLGLADRLGFEQALALAGGDPRALAERSAGWLLNGKAVVQESLVGGMLLARQGSDPALGKLARRLLEVRRQLAQRSVSARPPAEEKQRRGQIEELTREEQDLGKRLRQAGSKAAASSWVELGEVRKAIPDDSVLIDVARFRGFDFKAKSGEKKWLEERYAAWVTRGRGSVQRIDLGPASKIDEAVKHVRRALQAAPQEVKTGEEKAEKVLRVHLDALSRLILTPLLAHIGTSKRWLVSPDGNLWLLPFEALTLPDGKYAVEEHEIRYLTSSRDLLGTVAAKVKVTAPLVLADPDFDLDPGKARAEAKRLLGGASSEEGTRLRSGALRLGRAVRLAGTAAEARAIAPSLKGYAGVAPRVHTGAQALEGVFKAARSPRVLVLCTHGFFLPDQEVPREETPGLDRAMLTRGWENPLLRCGLLLAGCNNAGKVRDGDDGVLTGLEVVGTDLRGTELVVLSACETGVGEVQTGEGVAGLRQAFQLAGARSVVSTLWQVPDRSSARLMTFFFHNLGKGMSNAEALRAAKLKLIAERRDDFAAAHPFFWAAFTLTGQP
jgi:CHAT domain-containing protein